MDGLIRVTVRAWGPAIEWVGGETLEYALAQPATLGTVVELLRIKYPRLAAAGVSVRYAVNMEYARDATPLREGDEVAVIPPVAGGSAKSDASGTDAPHPEWRSDDGLVVLTHEPIVTAAWVRRVTHASCGTIVTFEGIVRAEVQSGDGGGGDLAALEYSAYHAMALRHMERIRDEAKAVLGVHEIAVVHRLGTLAIGEASIAIVVASPHRAAGFDACRHVIEAIKKDVPIWKKEIWARGAATWVAETSKSQKVETSQEE